jgi:hypothetical protein
MNSLRWVHASPTLSSRGRDSLLIYSQSCCDRRNAHKHDEELQDRGIAAIWLDVINSPKQYCRNDANAGDVNGSGHFPPPSETHANSGR